MLENSVSACLKFPLVHNLELLFSSDFCPLGFNSEIVFFPEPITDPYSPVYSSLVPAQPLRLSILKTSHWLPWNWQKIIYSILSRDWRTCEKSQPRHETNSLLFCQDNQERLSVVKLTRNNMNPETTGSSAFFANYGFHLCFHAHLSLTQRLDDTQTITFIATINNTEEIIRTNIVRAQDMRKEAAD